MIHQHKNRGATRSLTGTVQAILDLGRTMGLKVVAEGVGATEQGDLLTSPGCVMGQGLLHGRPTDMRQASDLLAEAVARI